MARSIHITVDRSIDRAIHESPDLELEYAEYLENYFELTNRLARYVFQLADLIALVETRLSGDDSNKEGFCPNEIKTVLRTHYQTVRDLIGAVTQDFGLERWSEPYEGHEIALSHDHYRFYRSVELAACYKNGKTE